MNINLSRKEAEALIDAGIAAYTNSPDAHLLESAIETLATMFGMVKDPAKFDAWFRKQIRDAIPTKAA